MKIVTLDFESFFDPESGYTLSKMTTEAYIRDPRFEALGCGFRWSTGALEWVDGGPVLERYFQEIDWASTACLCHHAQFDGLILSHHYGVKPAFWLDTLSMARMVVGNHLSVSLDSLAKHYQLPLKNVPYGLFKGKHWHELPPAERAQVADGCLHDISLTWSLFEILMNGWAPHLDFAGEPMLPGQFRDPDLMRPFPDEELKVIDLTVRMFTEPMLRGDIDLLGKVWMDEERRKASSLAELGVSQDDLQSSERFAELLRGEGVEPEIKESVKTPAGIYAFAKTDEFMKELIEDDGRAGALARARLGVRSTIDQTRAERLGYMATRGTLPVYLRYAGAHTTRWSGGDSLNWQNLRRGGDIRKSIKAPEGGALIVLDLAQIECRILNLLAGETYVVDAFREERDLYSETASRFYGRRITRDDKRERHLGKVLELGCGYGMGAPKLRATCRAGALGGPPIDLADGEAESAIRAYRSGHPRVVDYWATANRMIARLAGGEPLEWGPGMIRDGRLFGPNGAWIDYTTLEYDTEWQAWKHRTRQGWTKLYGGKLVENYVQFLARIVLSQAMIRIADLGYKIATCTHDEVVIALTGEDIENGSEAHFRACQTEMERAPAWLPDLPVKAEGGISERYEK